MAQIRPTANVYSKDGNVATSVKMPAVFSTPIRNDIVNATHDLMRHNGAQGHGVSEKAGHQTSAESWGTGRAVARIPRVRGGGTHRSGQGAYGNMCRGGHMFAPLKRWRLTHHRINIKQKRYAVAAAVASTGNASLAMARGHRVEKVPEFPLVLSDEVQKISKTKEAKACLKSIGAWLDIQKVVASESIRAGRGKMRNRRTKRKRGPIIIYEKDEGIHRGFRNIPGITLIAVSELNLLKLAPGGHLGRFAIYTESAFKQLDNIFGSTSKLSKEKNDYHLPHAIMKNTDLSAILSSVAVTSTLRPRKMECQEKSNKVRHNPLKHKRTMSKLNPYSLVRKHKLSKDGKSKK